MRNRKINCLRLVVLALLAVLSMLSNIGCYIHSEEREALAKDIESRYGKISPAGLEVLESIDKDTEKLIASRRTKYELARETSGTARMDHTWNRFIGDANSIGSTLEARYGEVYANRINAANSADRLKKQIERLDKKLAEMDAAIAKIQNTRNLPERLGQAEAIIKQVTQSLSTLITPSPVDARLSKAIGDINTYLGSLKSQRDKTEQTFSLILEALRMGRDITELEQESLQQQYNFHERLVAFYGAQERLLDDRTWIPGMVEIFWRYSPHTKLNATLVTLANDAESGSFHPLTSYRSAPIMPPTLDARKEKANDELRAVLRALAMLQTLDLTTRSRLDELNLRIDVEKYRNARLLDAVYERQRMSLISYGLKGVVRYSQGGFRKEDIARLINIAQTVAQIVIAVRVGR